MSIKFFNRSSVKHPHFKEGVVILVNKPLHWTSFNVVTKIRNKVSRIENVKRLKVGHAGTLDPLATGLLIICTGQYTKMIDDFQGQSKRYSGTFTLGATTPSYDLETEIDEKFPTVHITEKLLLEKANLFKGKIYQKPPVFSALKVDGERLYKKARRGEEIEIQTREIEIINFKLERIDLPEVDFVLDCSKGTYVRSLAFDYGKALNSGAYLSKLQRDKIGEFELEDAWDLEELIQVLDLILIKSKENVG